MTLIYAKLGYFSSYLKRGFLTELMNAAFLFLLLKEVLGDVLAEALSKVARERPLDPIKYVADYLHSVKGKLSMIL